MNKIDHKANDSFSLRYAETFSDRTILLQKIELLQMQNSELRKRQQYLKMINSTLLQALGNKEGLLINSNKEGSQLSEITNRYNSKQIHFIEKKQFQKSNKLIQSPKNSIYESQVKVNYQTLNHHKLNESQILSSKQKSFLKTKSPSFYQKRELNSALKSRSSTPKVQNSFLSNTSIMKNNNNNSSMDSFSLKKYFSKAQSQKNQFRSKANLQSRNIATALLCDLCGQSYSPLQFISHAQQCQQQENYENQLIKITDDESLELDQLENEEQELFEALEQEKIALIKQINHIKRNKNTCDKKLLRNLDQIVFVIKNKKALNKNDIKSLLKQNNPFPNMTARRR